MSVDYMKIYQHVRAADSHKKGTSNACRAALGSGKTVKGTTRGRHGHNARSNGVHVVKQHVD